MNDAEKVRALEAELREQKELPLPETHTLLAKDNMRLRARIQTLEAALRENYPLLLDGTWYEDHDAAIERLGRIRRALETKGGDAEDISSQHGAAAEEATEGRA